ncbi:MAG: ABC transporter ATP-binding protein [Actinomycetota bacterium]
MTAIVEVEDLTKFFGSLAAVNDVSFSVREHAITGLLGRNGAGKTTLLQLITGQEFITSGQIRLFGQSPLENAAVLSRTCFIKESQTYPDSFKGEHVLRVASWVFPHWDEALARELVAEFRVPLDRRMKKMSRGQASAVGVVVGLASRAELTIFDEPYAGLDAVARQAFYDHLLADYAEHPRTVIMSTHLIDEIADLLEHVLVIDDGQMIIDASAEDLRGSATTVSGKQADVEAFARGREVLDTGTLGGFASFTVTGLTPAEKAAAAAAGLDVGPVSLQQLVIGRTRGTVRQEVTS